MRSDSGSGASGGVRADRVEPGGRAAKPAGGAPAGAGDERARGGQCPGSGSGQCGRAPAAAGRAAASVPTLAPLSPSQNVKYAASQSVSSSGIFIGVERGYYKELGIDVEIVPFSNAAEMIQPIAASQVDVANADTGAGIFNALGRGLPLRFVADGNHTEPGHSSLAWVVRKDLIDSGAFRDLPDFAASGSARSRRARWWTRWRSARSSGRACSRPTWTWST